MAKVTITIDDTNPAIVAAFGANALHTIADQEFAYKEVVQKTEAELPDKIEVTRNEGIEGEPVTVLEYPEGTVLTKPNPDSRGQHIGKTILKENIIPRLLQGFRKRRQAEKATEVENEMATAAQVLEAAAEIKVE